MPLIAAEDTRHHPPAARPARDRDADDQLPRPERSRPGRGRSLEHLRGGADLALVTDAGTPAISDPGGELVDAWAGEGGRVVPIPGAWPCWPRSRHPGVAGPRWAFEGFLPRSGRERRERIARIAADERGTVIYEAPGRVAATLRDLADACGPGPPRRRLPRADQAPRDDRARGRSATWPRPRPRRRRDASRRAASSSWSWAPASAGVRTRALDEAAALDAARAEVEALVDAGVGPGRGRATGRGVDRTAAPAALRARPALARMAA